MKMVLSNFMNGPRKYKTIMEMIDGEYHDKCLQYLIDNLSLLKSIGGVVSDDLEVITQDAVESGLKQSSEAL